MAGIFARHIVEVTENGFDSWIGECIGDPLQNAIIGQIVIAVHQAYDIAGGPGDTLVQGVVDSIVIFAEHHHAVMACVIHGVERAVLRFALDDHMFKAGKALPCNTRYGFAHGRFGIINSGDDGNFQENCRPWVGMDH